MISWKVQNPNRLLTEVKTKLSGFYTTKQVRWSIEHNRCFINHRMERFGSSRVKTGDLIAIYIEKEQSAKYDSKRVVFEDESMLIYDKPPFCSSEEIAHHLNTLLVHRLDRDTTGLFLMAKHVQAQKELENQFFKRDVEKKYLAWVEGKMTHQGTIKGNMAPIYKKKGVTFWGLSKEGVWSETHWNAVKSMKNCTLLLCRPITGRMHQIRVHLSSIGYPILGDPIYGSRQQKKGIFRPLLHAHQLTFQHPATHQKVTFLSPLPSDFSF